MQAECSTDSDEPLEDITYKIGLVGPHGVGKTSIAQRFNSDSFSSRYCPGSWEQLMRLALPTYRPASSTDFIHMAVTNLLKELSSTHSHYHWLMYATSSRCAYTSCWREHATSLHPSAKSHQAVALQLWDISNDLTSLGMAANCLYGCHAVLIVYNHCDLEVRFADAAALPHLPCYRR
jgi:GTPase SAR1 family protein